jgi:hypothetical protein
MEVGEICTVAAVRTASPQFREAGNRFERSSGRDEFWEGLRRFPPPPPARPRAAFRELWELPTEKMQRRAAAPAALEGSAPSLPGRAARGGFREGRARSTGEFRELWESSPARRSRNQLCPCVEAALCEPKRTGAASIFLRIAGPLETLKKLEAAPLRLCTGRAASTQRGGAATRGPKARPITAWGNAPGIAPNTRKGQRPALLRVSLRKTAHEIGRAFSPGPSACSSLGRCPRL